MQCPYEEVLYGGAKGGGKALRATSSVLTPFGWREIRSLKIGQKVCSVDGSTTEVIGVYPQGKRQLYRLHFYDGATIDADSGHLWYGWFTANKRNTGIWKTSEIMEGIEKRGFRFCIPPIEKPAVFTVQGGLRGPGNFVGREIDPYLLGLLLGDGCITSKYIKITTMDQEIVDHCATIGDISTYDIKNSDVKEIRFVKQTRKDIVESLEKMGLLGTHSHDKFIPRQYLFAPVEERIALLQGLMDTDGWAEEGRAIHFASSSRELANGVRDIALSLGGIVTTRVKIVGGGEFKDSYCCRIKFEDSTIAFRLSRKKKIAETINHQDMIRYVERVEKIDVDDAVCIKVRHPSSLFITEDFVVTHNSAGLLGDFAQGIEQYGEQWIGVIIRKTFPELMEIELQAERLFGPHYGFNNYKRGEHKWILPSKDKGNSILYLKSMEDSRDKMKVHGYSLTWAGVDEATLWADDEIPEYLLTCMRSATGVPTFLRLTSNPGGPGHDVIKKRFKIGMIPDMTPIKTFVCECREGRVEFVNIDGVEHLDRCEACGSDKPDELDPGHTKVFIPAKVTDNTALMKNDPGYYYKLAKISDPIMRRAYLYGDWDIAQGAAFPEFRDDTHVIAPYQVPEGARVWRTMDWGYDKPFACLWVTMNFDGQLVICREFYGCGLKPNQGIRMDPEIVAKKIKDIEAENRWNVVGAFLDPQCWAQHGSEDIFKLLGGYKMKWRPWPKVDRTVKKQTMHSYLKSINGVPRLVVMRNCKEFIRTIKAIQTNGTRIEDVATDGEDHSYDAITGLLQGINVKSEQKAMQSQEQAWLTQFDNEPSEEGSYGGW